jgi:hypothetical protein
MRNFKMSFSALILVAIASFIGCKKDDPAPLPTTKPPYEITEYTALPTDTDAQITKGLSNQYAYVPKDVANRKNKLFIFIPGTFAKPQTYLKIIQSGAKQGYHTMGISYDNSAEISTFCSGTSDANCTGNVLKEFFDGTDASTLVAIGSAENFVNRFVKMLNYLNSKYPSDNWKQFLSGTNDLNWSMVSVAGHSQGSAHTLYISKQKNILRAGMFSGPNATTLSNGTAANWFIAAGQTPTDKIYAFSNVNDNLAVYAALTFNWTTLGLLGTPTSVDNATTFTSHQLTTAVIPPPTSGSASPTHGSTTVDIVTPLDANGNPVFEKVWIYMCLPD